LDRTNALKKLAFEREGMDAFLVGNEKNLLYLTGTPGAFCLLIPRRGQNTVFVYGVNYEATKVEAKGFEVELLKTSEKLGDKFVQWIKSLRIKTVGVDSVSHDFYAILAKAFRGHAKLKARGDLVWKLRRVKDETELKLMREAGLITSAGMQAASESIRPGITEIEVAAEIEYAMRKKGGWGTGFETIVASGIRSAFPHGGCVNRKIREKDLVVVDIGSMYERYHSDMTRTFVAGIPTPKQEKMFEVVKAAHGRAYEAIRAGARARKVDEVARKAIEHAGFEQYFVHGLGHGVGLDIHEPPALAASSKDTLVVGNVVTDEPGVYIPGFGGLRIEDTVLVQKEKAEKLTKGPYTLRTQA
jgi:Xaa-Pro aminopeptidase